MEREYESRRTRESKKSGGIIGEYFQTGAMDLSFFIIIMILVVVGLVMLYTASYANAYYNEGDSTKYFRQQTIFAIAGVIAMLMISRVSAKFYKRWVFVIYGGTLALLIFTLIINHGKKFKRWVELGPIRFQPSEVAKFAMIVCVACMVAKYYKNMTKIRFTLMPLITITFPIALLVVAEKHVSATVILVTISLVMIIVSGGNIKFMLASGGIVAAAGTAFVFLSNNMGYALERIHSYRDPLSDLQGKGWQTMQSLYALGSGGILGQGFGKSTQKYLYIPEPQNDFIFAIIGEELGFIGALLIIGLFGYFIYRGFVIAMRARDRFSTMLALGIIFQVGLQCALNLMVVSKVIPNTGISLPFFSYGGTSLLMILGEMGVLLSISRASTVRKMN